MTNQTNTTSQASANLATSQSGQGKVQNSQDQAALADKAFADYDFGEGVTVFDTGNWEYLDPGHERSRKVYVETDREDDGPAPRWTLNFNVRFNEVDGSLAEAYALDQKGQPWGRMPEQELQGNVESANDDAIHDIVEDVLERAVKHDFRPDEDMVRGAVEGSANLLNLILTERQVADACARILDRINEPDGARTTAFEVTVEDVVNVLCSNSPAVANTSSKSFESMANELYGNLDFHLIEQAALAGDELDEQTNYANDEIARQLRDKGVLEPLKSACDSPSPGM